MKEQKRLNSLLEKKDKKIHGQSIIIQKMKNLIELQKLRIKTEDFSTLVSEDQQNPGQPTFLAIPTIVIEDTNLLACPSHTSLLRNTEPGKKEERGHQVNLKRQQVLTKKSSERPRITTANHNHLKSSLSCQNLSFILEKPQVPSRTNVNVKLYGPIYDNTELLYGPTNHNTDAHYGLTNQSTMTNNNIGPGPAQSLSLTSDEDSGHWSLDNEATKHHTIFRTNSYEKAIGLDEHTLSTAKREGNTGFYRISKFASQPQLYF